MSIEVLHDSIILQGEEYTIDVGDNISFNAKEQHIYISQDLLKECQGDILCAGLRVQLMYQLQYVAKDRPQRRTLALSQILRKSSIYSPLIVTLQDQTDPFHNDPLIQCFFLSQLAHTGGLHPLISRKLEEPIDKEKITPVGHKKAWEKIIDTHHLTTIADALQLVVQECYKHDVVAILDGLRSGESNPLSTPLQLLSSLASSQGLLDLCSQLSSSKKDIKKERRKQEEHKNKEKKERNITQGVLNESQKSYKPKDSIKNLEGEKNIVVIGTWHPPLGGYFKEKVGHGFDMGLEWNTDLTGALYSPKPAYKVTHAFETVLPGSGGPVLLPFPDSMIPVAWDQEHISIRQGVDGMWFASGTPGIPMHIGCTPLVNISQEDTPEVYISSPETFTKSLIFSLDDSIKTWLEEQPTDDPVKLISMVANHIRSKIYSTQYQGTYQQEARDGDDYITKLWHAPKLECYSANHLMVALSRYCNIPARLAMGYHSTFVHEGRTAITQDDGHAWCEIYVDGSRQRWDVTPIVPDPDDPSQAHGDDKAQEQDEETSDQNSSLESLEQEVSLDERMRRELLQSLKTQEELNIPEISAQCREGISLEQAKYTYDLLKKNKRRSEKFAKQLKEWLQTFTESKSKEQIYTKRNTGNVAMLRVMNNPKLLNQDPEEILKLANEELSIRQSHEVITSKEVGLPDELHLHIYIDVSGSMNNHFSSVKNDLVMIWDSMRHVQALTQHLGMHVSAEVHAFGDKYVQFTQDKGTSFSLDMSDKSIATLSRLLTYIPHKFQDEAGTGNSENKFYNMIIQCRLAEVEQEQNLQKNVRHIGISFTDQATLTNEPDSFDQVTINNVVIPEQTATERLEAYLTILQDLNLPIIAVNCEGKAKGDSGYVSYIAGGDTQFATMPDNLFKELKDLVPIEK